MVGAGVADNAHAVLEDGLGVSDQYKMLLPAE